MFVCLFVWVEALRPSQQFFSRVGTEPPLPGYYQYFLGGKCILGNLMWNNYFQHVSKKISSYLWLLSKIRSYLSVELRLMFYNAYVKPHFEHCSTVWSNTSSGNAPVMCIPCSLGARDSGDIAGPECRDLTFDASRQCRRCAGVLISRQNANLCHILTIRGKVSLFICTV